MHTTNGDTMNNTAEQYCKLIKKIETERNKLLEEIYIKGKDTEFNREYLEKYNRLLEKNCDSLLQFMNESD